MGSYFDLKDKEHYKFWELPLGAKKAIAGRWFIEARCFLGGGDEALTDKLCEFLPETAHESNYAQELSESQWSSILELIENHYRETNPDFTFTYFEAPTELVKHVLLRTVIQGYSDWESYSKAYGNFPKHSEINRFPCIANMNSDDDCEVIEDGWHRLHSYINQGHITIPIIEV